MDRFEAFANLIMEINRSILRIKDNEMKQLGLKASHTMCLYQLGQHKEGLTATQLTEACCVDKAAISRTLKQLQEKDLVYCNLPANKRSYRTLFFLTDAGVVLADDMNKRIENALSNGSSGITRKERVSMYKALDIIRTNLNNYIEEFEDSDN